MCCMIEKLQPVLGSIFVSSEINLQMRVRSPISHDIFRLYCIGLISWVKFMVLGL